MMSRIFAIGIALGSFVEEAVCQVPVLDESLKFVSPDPAANDAYGVSVAIRGDRALIGEDLDDQQAVNAGAAFLYRREGNGWALTQRLVASDPTPSARFGGRVWLYDGIAFVHAVDVSAGIGGAIYVFEEVGAVWTQTQKLVSSIPQANQSFGFSLALGDDVLLIGVPHRHTSAGTFSGVVLSFERTQAGWQEVGELQPNSPAMSGCFGTALAIEHDLAAIGAHSFDGGIGAAFVFDRSSGSWAESAVLRPAAGSPSGDNRFGRSIAMSQQAICVGRPARGGPFGEPPGSVHVYHPDAHGRWVEAQRLYASDGTQTNWFGEAISLQGNTLVVGAPLQDGLAASSGAAYVFQRVHDSWTETAKLTASDSDSSDDRLGQTVSTDNGTVLCGAHFDGAQSGAAYLYDLPLGAAFCPPAVTSTGLPAHILARGSYRVSESVLTLIAVQLPPGQFGYFIVSRTQTAPFTPPGASGSLCLAGDIGRFNSLIDLVQGPSGSIRVPFDALPVNPVAPIVPGDTWNFQCWFRDVGSSNFTNALSLVFE
ncbi:MAG: hypothetical protein GY722_03895 [bacterium]|nr:hypothetical protein [bacterium]